MLETLSSPGNTDWFVHDRFGLFIHWGLYALPARHEWVMSKERIPLDQYRSKYFKHFDPDLYDPDVWAKAAADAGMKYFVITTKHHDGFCLWDSEHTDYKVTNTPYGKDLLRPMVDAFNARGLRTGLYHSLIDWSHPQYVIDRRNHPRRGELPPIPEIEEDGMLDQTGPAASKIEVEVSEDDINAGRNQAAYAEYLRDQVRELLTDFDPVEVLWFDFSFVDQQARTDFSRGKGWEAWQADVLYKTIRELAPNVILTNRLDLDMPLSGGDILTPEQSQPRGWVHTNVDGKQVPVVWEACQTMSGSWGYFRDEHTWRSTRQLIATLIDCVSKGGNLLLNVGPTGRGEIDHRAMDRLDGIGKWMHHHSRSIYGCTQAPDEFACPTDCRLTYHPEKNRLYLHILEWPYKHLHLDGKAFGERVEYCQFLHDASEVKTRMDAWHAQHTGGTGDVVLNLPQTEPNVEVPVVEIFLK